MTTLKPPRNRRLSTRVQPKRAIAAATKAASTRVAAVVPGISVELEPSLEIKEAESVHRLLLAALRGGGAVTVDVGGVRSVDTAGAQLLLAFQDEASRRGVTIEFRGESAALTRTLAVLGLGDKISVAALRG